MPLPTAFTFDAYDTLFDLRGRLTRGFAEFFRETGVSADPEKVIGAWLGAGQTAFVRRYESSDRAPFKSVRELNVECFVEAFRQEGLDVDPEVAADMADRCLQSVEPFPDVQEALDELARLVPLALLSDIDAHQIGPVLKRHRMPFRCVVISEDERAYKIRSDGRLFRVVAGKLGVPLEQIAHAGDSLQDVIGGRRAGVRAIWVNRRGIGWPRPDMPPHMTVSNLRELVERVAEL